MQMTLLNSAYPWNYVCRIFFENVPKHNGENNKSCENRTKKNMAKIPCPSSTATIPGSFLTRSLLTAFLLIPLFHRLPMLVCS